MLKWIDRFVLQCVRDGYLSEEEAPWLQYGIEKILSNVVVSVPFIILGISISSAKVSFAFYLGFCILRARTNGYHAKSIWGCFIASIILEFIFIKGIYPYLNQNMLVPVLLLSSLFIFFLAPYKHENMQLSEVEVTACATGARIRLLFLLICAGIMRWLGEVQISKGLVLGIVMAATMLVVAYIKNIGGKNNEKRKN